MVTPGSVGDWTQASIMAAALAGLAATCWRALREEDAHALARPPSGLADAPAAAEHVKAVQEPPAPGLDAASSAWRS